MSDTPQQLLVTDVPSGTAIDRVSHALSRRRFHHVSDIIGPLVRVWVYCPGGHAGVRSVVRGVIETALAEDGTPSTVAFADEHRVPPRLAVTAWTPHAGQERRTAPARVAARVAKAG